MSEARPTAFTSYAQTSPDWQQTVLLFTTAMRTRGGVAVEMDLWHGADHQEWSAFGPNLIASSDFILIAVDSAYKRRWAGTEAPGIGAGAIREASAIKAILERDRDEFRRRVKVVVLPGSTKDDIPEDLRGLNEYFVISSLDEAGLEPLLRSIWGVERLEKPPLGPIPKLPQIAVADLEREIDKSFPAATATHGAAGDRSPDSRSSQTPSPETIDARDKAMLEERLQSLDAAIAQLAPDDLDGNLALPAHRHAHRLMLDRSAVLTALDAIRSTDPPSQADRTEDALPEPLARIVAGLEDHDEDVRFEAMGALRNRLVPALLPVIVRMLDDPDHYIRQMAYEYYGELAGPDGRQRLVAGLDDGNDDVRFTVMSSLRDRLEPGLRPTLVPLLRDPDTYIRRMAVEYYGEIAGPEGTSAIVDALKDSDEDVRFAAMNALRDRLTPDLLAAIEPLLDDADRYIRRMAMEYYAELT